MSEEVTDITEDPPKRHVDSNFQEIPQQFIGYGIVEKSTQKPVGINSTDQDPRYEVCKGTGYFGSTTAVLPVLDKKLGQVLAVKLLWPNLIEEPFIDRMKPDDKRELQKYINIINASARSAMMNEPKAIGKLKPPTPVKVYDAFETVMPRGINPDGTLREPEACIAIIMEELHSEDNLSNILKAMKEEGRQLPIPVVKKISESLTQFADYLGSEEINSGHYDLKPLNIFLTNYGNEGEDVWVQVVDFGNSRIVQSASELELWTLGTQEYAAPEQSKGVVQNLDTTTDLYSIGLILYEVLVGEQMHNYEGGFSLNGMTPEQEDKLVQAMSGRVDDPHAVAAVINKATKLKKSERYQSGKALQEGLEKAFATGEET